MSFHRRSIALIALSCLLLCGALGQGQDAPTPLPEDAQTPSPFVNSLAACFPAATLQYWEVPDVPVAELFAAAALPPFEGEATPEVVRERVQMLDWLEAREALASAFLAPFSLETADVRAAINEPVDLALGIMGVQEFAPTLGIVVRSPEAAAWFDLLRTRTEAAGLGAMQNDLDGQPRLAFSVPEDLDTGLRQLLGLNPIVPDPVALLFEGVGSQWTLYRRDDLLVFLSSAGLAPEMPVLSPDAGLPTLAEAPGFQACHTRALADPDADALMVFNIAAFMQAFLDMMPGYERNSMIDGIQMMQLDRIREMSAVVRVDDAGLHFDGVGTLLRMGSLLEPPEEDESEVPPEEEPADEETRTSPSEAPSLYDALREDPTAPMLLQSIPAGVGVMAWSRLASAQRSWAAIASHLETVLPPDEWAYVQEQLEESATAWGLPLEELLAFLGDEIAVAVYPPDPDDAPPDPEGWYTPSPQPQVLVVGKVRNADAAREYYRFVLEDLIGQRELAVEEWAVGEETATVFAHDGEDVYATCTEEFVVLASHYRYLRQFLDLTYRTPEAGPSVADEPAYARVLANLPANVSRLGMGNLDAWTEMMDITGAMGEILGGFLAGTAIGMAVVEEEATNEDEFAQPRWRLALAGDRPWERAREALASVAESRRVAQCRTNLAALGNALWDYYYDRGRWPSAFADLVSAGLWDHDRRGSSPLEAIAARAMGEATSARIESYTLAPVPYPERLDPAFDPPFVAPINSPMLAYTVRPVYRGGHHVLMANGTVHWVTPELLRELLRMAEAGLTMADEDRAWNRQAPGR